MNFTGYDFHQGDVEFFSIDQLPQDVKKIDKSFIAASERSGSFHALFGNYDMYEAEGGICLDLKEDCILNHSLKADLDAVNNNLNKAQVIPKKDHRHTVVPKGIYYTGIQNKLDPLSGIKKRVID